MERLGYLDLDQITPSKAVGVIHSDLLRTVESSLLYTLAKPCFTSIHYYRLSESL